MSAQAMSRALSGARSPKKCQNHTLQFFAGTLRFLLHTLMEGARLPCGEYEGIDVGLPADRNGIAQLAGDFFDGADDAGSDGAFCREFR